MHVLFITETYENLEKQIKANSLNTLVATFAETYKYDKNYTYKHIGIYEPILFEEGIKSGEELDKVLLNEKFDIAIVSMHRDVTISIDVAKVLGKKLFITFWDTHMSAVTSDINVNFKMFTKSKPASHLIYKHSIDEYSEYCNCLIGDYGYKKISNNIYGFCAPQLESEMKPLNVEKIYDVSFIGTAYTHERIEFIDLIEKSGIKVHIFGGRRFEDEWLSVADYSMKINQTKINLNFNHSNIQAHRKGRAFEVAACGGFMLSTHPEVFKTKNLNIFNDTKDFISVHKYNIVEKIRYYLNHDEEREQIAKSIYQTYIKNLQCKKTWDYILSLVEDK
jgi:RNAse (barnase) inhibitor barstar